MRLAELASSLVFWLGTPAAAYGLVTQLDWVWWQALLAAVAAGTLAALLTSMVVAQLTD